MSHICHVDESGDFGALKSADAGAQPTLVVAGLIVPDKRLARMEAEFLNLRKTSEFLKSRRSALNLASFPLEDKGKDMFRWALRSRDAEWQSAALLVLGLTLDLLERAEARVAGCVHLKPADGEFDGRREYASSVLSIAANFRRIPGAGNGRIICDEQQQAKSVVRRLFRRRQLPSPEFCNSGEIAGLQLADWICSGIIAPLAAAACFDKHDLPGSKHVAARYLALREGENSPWARLARMQFPLADANGLRRPGILVHPEEFRPRLFASSHL